MTLAEKLHAIQKLARKVPKRGRHERGWSYVRIEDVVTVATRLMSEHKLILTPDVKSLTRSERGGGSVVDLMVRWELTDMEKHEDGPNLLSTDIPGSGFDYDSKGTAKALTDSRKNVMILLFNLKGGDDPERAPMTRTESKQSREDIVESKLANAAAGKGIDADVPKLFYEIFAESQTVKLTGDKELLKHAALKPYKLGRDIVVPSGAWDALKGKIEDAGIPVSNLRTQ